MFIIGILSSPIPYVLISFVYLLGLSYGLFTKHEKINNREEICSNIINYEELNPTVETSDEVADYFSFLKSTTNHQNIHFSEALKMFFGKLQLSNFIIEKTDIYNILLHSYLSNRPPPSSVLS